MAEVSSASSSPGFWSAVLSGKSDKEKEELLDRMLTRFALCDDSNLQNLLGQIIPISIAALSSASVSVRNKVVEILAHVNRRVKHQHDIALPLFELWKLHEESVSYPMIRSFCLVYIEMAIDRVSNKEKELMAPQLLSNICELLPPQQDLLLRTVAKVIGECHASGINDDVLERYRMLAHTKDCEIFLDFCLHTILYQPSFQSVPPAGLSTQQCERVTGKNPLNGDLLSSRKSGMLNIIEGMHLPPEVVYPIYVTACADSYGPVIKKGEELLKKISSAVSLDDQNLINKLFLLFNGSAHLNDIPPESKVKPGNLALRLKLMPVFCHSITAANSFPSTLQCIFGCILGSDTTARLKQLGLEFAVWVFKHARLEQLKLMGPIILTGVLKTLDNSSLDSDALARETRSFCFQAIGLLAQRMPLLFRNKIDVAVRLFEALKLEGPSLRLIVQEATNSLAAAYKGASPEVLKDVELLLIQNYKMEQSEGRFCAVRWATLLFGLNHCASRFVCMLGAADSKLDIREMSLEGLFPGEVHTSATVISPEYPKLSDMLHYIGDQQPAIFDYSGPGDEEIFPSKTLLVMIKFLLRCFEAEAGRTEPTMAPEILQPIERFCLLLEHALTQKGSAELTALASKALITVAAHLPQMVASRYAEKVTWLRQYLSHFDVDTRESIARLLGIASMELPFSSSYELIAELASSISGKQNLRYEAQHGLLSALGYVTANCLLREPSMSQPVLQSALVCLVDVINNETAALASVAMQALGHIGLCISLPLLRVDSTEESIWTILHGKLIKLLVSDDIKAVQKTVIALGHMCVKESDSNIAVDLIFSLSRSKVEDILFAAGEALSFLWGGVPVTVEMILRTNYSSLSMISNFLLGNVSSSLPRLHSLEFQNDENYHRTIREAVRRKIFDDLLSSTRKDERCSGTVWLLSLTIYCGHHYSIQELLPDIQEAFSHLIGEQNELTQELASQGLSIVYELGNDDMKKNLVNSLVGTLTGSGKRKRTVKLDENSEVFQEGSFGESPSGGKISTYKELCSLANEIGQPDLIYKFMDLSNYQASLNSKRGAAFGFSKIAEHAGDALQPYLHALIPRLFRYQYDPDKNVQDAMAHIWKSLVADSKKAVDEHLDLIFEDLLQHSGSRLWRSREASCLALADVLQGRKFLQVKNHLGRIWTSAFRAMDDIKETVRNAGERLCRAVASLTARLCDTSLTPLNEGQQALAIVLPLLLTDGIVNKVENIRKASINLVMKLAKAAGAAIRPYITDLVCCMLESLSSLEDQGMNYVELHAERVGIQADKLENLRISIARGSPMWETLELCIDVIDSSSLEVLIPRIAQMIRSSIGLNTRVGIASFIHLLVQKVGADIKLFTSSLLKLLLPAVRDEKSSSSKRAFANACSMVLKYATPLQAQNLIEQTINLHAGDRNDQITCAVLLKSYASTAADVFSGYHAVVVPVVFISRFEEEKTISTVYEELWEENMSSDRIALQLYLGEIVTLINNELVSSSWTRKKMASICKLSEVLGASLSSHHHILLTSLMKELTGRLWEGKDVLLNALSALCTSCHEAICASDPDAPNTILSLVSSGCTKKAPKYREAAFKCLEQVIKAFAKPDFFNTVLPSLLEMGNSFAQSSSQASSPMITVDKTDGDERNASSAAATHHDKLLSCITACIHIAAVDDILEHSKDLINFYSLCLSAALHWTVKVSIFTSVKELSSKLQSSIINRLDDQSRLAACSREMFHTLVPELLKCLQPIKIAQVHIAGGECVVELTNLYVTVAVPSGREEGGWWSTMTTTDLLLEVCEAEKNEVARSSFNKCYHLL
ncbi:hypothetical protein M569_09623, partial [Genlisea aurea]